MASDLTTNFDEKWTVIQNGVKQVTNTLEGCSEESINGDQYIDLYSTVSDLCLNKNADRFAEVYDRYKALFKDYINSKVLPALRQKHGELLLSELVRRWENHKVMVRWLSMFFSYLDRVYATKKLYILPLRDAGLRTFIDLVYEEVKNNATNAVIALIEKEREGEQINRSLLKNVVGIFLDIGMGEMDCYEKDFQTPMLEESGTYYSRKASSWIIDYSCPDYLLKVEECLQLEKDRVSHYLHASSEEHLLDVVQNKVLAHYENQILEKDSGLWALLRDDKQDDLSRMFKLFAKVDKGLDPIANIFKQFVIAEGTALIKHAEDAVTNNKGRRDTSGTLEQGFIRKVMEMHDKYEHYVSECFQNNKLLKKFLDAAFEAFCNKTIAGSSAAELLSAFSDDVLKKGDSNDYIDRALEKVVTILSYVQDKDLFAEHYRKKLARRFVFERSTNLFNERSMLTKLKQQNGTPYTTKMEGMVTDISLVRDNHNDFVAYLNSEGIHVGLDLSVTVLTHGYWPTYKSANINLPRELVNCIDIFKQFYSKQTKDRKLIWMYSLGTCIVEGRFNANAIELILTPYQAALLMMFNESEKLSFDDVKSQLNMEDEDANRVLSSLACTEKYKVLLKESKTKKISPTDCFEVNSRFEVKNNRSRIKIPLPESDEKKKIVEDVRIGREYVIDAAIVRIMKSRKVLSLQQIQSECVDQLRRSFKPDFIVIKKRVEDLITREFLERDENDPNVFKYLA